MNSHKDILDPDSMEMKVIRVFLIAFIILLGFQAVQFINTRVIDKKHSELLVVKTKSVEAMQNLLIQSSTIQRKLLNLALSDSPTEKSQLEGIIATAAAANDKALKELEATAIQLTPNGNRALADLDAANVEYSRTFTVFMDLLKSGDREAAIVYKNENLRPAYESYQHTQHQVLIAITDELVSESNKVSRYTATSGWILFFLGLAPFIYGISKLVYLSILLKFKSSRISTIGEETKSRS